MREQISRIIQERDSFKNDTAELLKSKKLVEKQYAFDKMSSKEREVKLSKQLASANKDNNENMDKILTLEKTCK